MARLILILASVALIAGAVPGCGKNEPTRPNQPPTVSWVRTPDLSRPVAGDADFAWSGADPDGAVDHYEVSLDSEDAYAATGDTARTLAFTRADGTDSNPQNHVFRVRAVDDKGLAGAVLSAGFVVAFPNQAPTVAFTGAPPSGVFLGPSVSLSWHGEDPDGSIAAYEYVLDDTAAAWTATPDTVLALDFNAPGAPRPAPLHHPVDHTFYLRALDNDGKRSTVVHTGFTAGPDNRPPAVALDVYPQGTVTGQASWSWTGTDPDGEILAYQWAIDLVDSLGWRTAGPATTDLTRTFTRADGTAEAPRTHAFSVRAMDDDSTLSATVTRSFTVGVPNQPPTVLFNPVPDPNLVRFYQVPVVWKGQDDVAIAAYFVAVDDTSSWTQLAASVTSRTFVLSCPDPSPYDPPLNATAPFDTSLGAHTVYLKAQDGAGLQSATVSAPVKVSTRTPYTTITDPVAADGAVTALPGPFPVVWTGRDPDRPVAPPQSPAGYDYKTFTVTDFSQVPDARAAVLADGSAWVAVTPGVGQVTLTLVPGRRYVLALRARDEAGAIEPYFDYGRNVLKITVP